MGLMILKNKYDIIILKVKGYEFKKRKVIKKD